MSAPGGWAAPGQPPSQPVPTQPPQASPVPPAAPPHTASAGERGTPQPPQAQGRPQPPGPGWPPPPVTYQPGVIPFRPLGLGDVYGAAFKIIKGNPAATVGAALVIALIALIPTTPLGLWVARQGSSDFLDPTAPIDQTGAADVILVTAGQYIPTIAGSLATVALAGFIAYVTGQAVLGRKVKLPEAWRGTRPHLLRVIGVSLLVSFVIFAVAAAFLAPGIVLMVIGASGGDDGLVVGGLVTLLGLGLLLIPTLLFLWTRLAFVGPAVVLERAGIGQSIRRSWRLTRFPGFWRLLGIRVLTAVLVSLVAQVLVIPVTFALMAVIIAGGMSADGLVTMQVVVGALVTLISAAATTPVTATVDTLLYVDQRMRTEALDVHLIQSVEGRAPLPWQPASEPLARPVA